MRFLSAGVVRLVLPQDFWQRGLRRQLAGDPSVRLLLKSEELGTSLRTLELRRHGVDGTVVGEHVRAQRFGVDGDLVQRDV